MPSPSPVRSSSHSALNSRKSDGNSLLGSGKSPSPQRPVSRALFNDPDSPPINSPRNRSSTSVQGSPFSDDENIDFEGLFSAPQNDDQLAIFDSNTPNDATKASYPIFCGPKITLTSSPANDDYCGQQTIAILNEITRIIKSDDNNAETKDQKLTAILKALTSIHYLRKNGAAVNPNYLHQIERQLYRAFTDGGKYEIEIENTSLGLVLAASYYAPHRAWYRHGQLLTKPFTVSLKFMLQHFNFSEPQLTPKEENLMDFLQKPGIPSALAPSTMTHSASMVSNKKLADTPFLDEDELKKNP